MSIVTAPRPEIGWSAARTATDQARRERDANVLQWRSCPLCWGQRKIWTREPEGYAAWVCPFCLGVGEVCS